jgi:hypothetical protein
MVFTWMWKDPDTQIPETGDSSDMTDNTRPRWISTFESFEIRNPKNGCNLSQVDTLHSRLFLKLLQLTDGGAKVVPKWYKS